MITVEPEITPHSTLQPLVPARLLEPIVAHAVRNFAGLPGPLMMGIQGPSGVGKTFGLHRGLSDIGVKRLVISAGRLEDREAGVPARLIRSSYLSAGRAVSARRGAALIFEDVDAGLGDWGHGTQYTVNRQTATAELMRIADFPEGIGGKRIPRVPIFLTGNDFGKLYRPLVRSGRMRLLEWKLTAEERIDVIQRVFHELESMQVWEIADRYRSEPIAFFADVRRRYEETALRRAIRKLTGKEAVRRALHGRLTMPTIEITFREVLTQADALRSSCATRNHLSEDEA